MALASEPGASVTLAYRRKTFDHATKAPAKGCRLWRAMARWTCGSVSRSAKSQSMRKNQSSTAKNTDWPMTLAIDDVIICAAGVRSNQLLDGAGVTVERKFGTASNGPIAHSAVP
jgi:hypothetical protein